MLIDGLLLLLLLIGILISLYFTLVYYQRIPANYFLVPRVCRMKESACQTVLSTRDARVFGIPNFVVGVLYYFIVFLVVAAGIENEWVSELQVLFYVSLFVVLFGGYLTYSLLFKIKIFCPLCFVSHGINAFIALLFFLKSL